MPDCLQLAMGPPSAQYVLTHHCTLTGCVCGMLSASCRDSWACGTMPVGRRTRPHGTVQETSDPAAAFGCIAEVIDNYRHNFETLPKQIQRKALSTVMHAALVQTTSTLPSPWLCACAWRNAVAIAGTPRSVRAVCLHHANWADVADACCPLYVHTLAQPKQPETFAADGQSATIKPPMRKPSPAPNVAAHFQAWSAPSRPVAPSPASPRALSPTRPLTLSHARPLASGPVDLSALHI